MAPVGPRPAADEIADSIRSTFIDSVSARVPATATGPDLHNSRASIHGHRRVRHSRINRHVGEESLHQCFAPAAWRLSVKHRPLSSLGAASNESFSGWTKTFTDPGLCAAIVDRLTFGGNFIETGTDPYRLAHTKNQLKI